MNLKNRIHQKKENKMRKIITILIAAFFTFIIEDFNIFPNK